MRGEMRGEMRGFGVGLSRYKNQDSYVAIVAEVSVAASSGAVKVLRMWSATDAGRAINPDRIINQIEGGMVQAASWTLIESVRSDTQRAAGRGPQGVRRIDAAVARP